MANIITGCRIVCSILLLFTPVFSPAFYTWYLLAVFTDMIDGTVARKTKTVSEFGSKLDTIADFIFIIVCLLKLIPVLAVPKLLWLWVGIIAAIKIFNVIRGFRLQKQLAAEHTVMNKVTGLLLFILPVTMQFIELRYSAVVVCTVATFAAIQEGTLIRKVE